MACAVCGTRRFQRGGVSGAITERGAGETAAALDEVQIARNAMMHVVAERCERLADARAVEAVAASPRHPRDQRALDLLLQVEDRRVARRRAALSRNAPHARARWPPRAARAASCAIRTGSRGARRDTARSAARSRARRPSRSRARAVRGGCRKRRQARRRYRRATKGERRAHRSSRRRAMACSPVRQSRTRRGTIGKPRKIAPVR